MKFPNAAKGVKRIFTAEVLNLIATICLAVAAVLIVVAVASGKFVSGRTSDALFGGSMLGAILFALAWLVLTIIGFIMKLVGIINASKDEASFKSALVFLIVSIVASIVSSVLMMNNVNTAGNLLYTFAQLVEVFITIFVIAGGVKLADRLNRGDVGSKGTNVLKIIIVVNVLMLIANLVSSFMGGIAASVVSGVLLIVALVLEIVQYFLYLSFLNKAKKMLTDTNANINI